MKSILSIIVAILISPFLSFAKVELPDLCDTSLYACPIPAALVTGKDTVGIRGITWRNTTIEVYTEQGMYLGDALIDRSGNEDIVPWSLDLSHVVPTGRYYVYYITYNLSKRDQSYKSASFPIDITYSSVNNSFILKDTEVQISTTPLVDTSKMVKKESILPIQTTETVTKPQDQQFEYVATDYIPEKTITSRIVGYTIMSVVIILLLVALIAKKDDGTEINTNPIKKLLTSLWNTFLGIRTKTIEKTTASIVRVKEKTIIIFNRVKHIVLKFKEKSNSEDQNL